MKIKKLLFTCNRLVGWTNINGLFLSDRLSPSDYDLKVKGFFPWQKKGKKINLEKGMPKSINFFV